MKIERLQQSIQTVKENIAILESQQPKDAGYYLQLEHEKMVLDALEKQIPKKPYLDNDNGVYDKEHCPNCHRSLFPNDHHCRCEVRLLIGATTQPRKAVLNNDWKYQ